jgi:hypothetical protein
MKDFAQIDPYKLNQTLSLNEEQIPVSNEHAEVYKMTNKNR